MAAPAGLPQSMLQVARRKLAYHQTMVARREARAKEQARKDRDRTLELQRQVRLMEDMPDYIRESVEQERAALRAALAQGH